MSLGFNWGSQHPLLTEGLAQTLIQIPVDEVSVRNSDMHGNQSTNTSNFHPEPQTLPPHKRVTEWRHVMLEAESAPGDAREHLMFLQKPGGFKL